MEVLNQMNCVFVPFDHCHLCIKPPLLTRASGVNKASHLKETCHNCSMTPQYHTPSTRAPTQRSMTAQTRHWLTRAAPVVLRATVIGYMLPIMAWWKFCLTRRFRLQWDPKIECNRLDLVDQISYWLLSGSPDRVNTGNLGKSMFQLKTSYHFMPSWGLGVFYIFERAQRQGLLMTEGLRGWKPKWSLVL